MIHVYTGNGKGKTTAALGLAMRAIGDGKTVCMIQFIKGPWPSGEDKSHQAFGDNLKLIKGGKGFVGILNDQLPRSEHEKSAQETLEIAKKEIKSGKWDIIILDEINVAVDLKLVSVQEVIDVIGFVSDQRLRNDVIPAKAATAVSGVPHAAVRIQSDVDSGSRAGMTKETKSSLIILTGRNAPSEFIEIADLITEMKEIKHYYQDGQMAQRGVEY